MCTHCSHLLVTNCMHTVHVNELMVHVSCVPVEHLQPRSRPSIPAIPALHIHGPIRPKQSDGTERLCVCVRASAEHV